ncbi:MAG: glycosyltransferase family 9 protein [bacterium]
MGDTLLMTPLIRLFKQTYPHIAIDTVLNRLPSEVLRNNPYIGEVIVAPSKEEGWKGFLHLIRVLRSRSYDAVVDFLSTPSSAAVSFLTGARVRIGWNLRFRRVFYSHLIERSEEVIYGVKAKAQLLQPFDIKVHDDDLLLPEVFLSQEDEDWADNWWREWHCEALVWALAPFCRKKERMWDVTLWAQLLENLSNIWKIRFALLALESEREDLRLISETLGPLCRWVGAPDPLKAAAVMKRCQLALTGENGILHLGISVRVPLVAIFSGKDDPRLWVPYHPSGIFDFVDLRTTEDGSDEQLSHSSLQSTHQDPKWLGSQVLRKIDQFVRNVSSFKSSL